MPDLREGSLESVSNLDETISGCGEKWSNAKTSQLEKSNISKEVLKKFTKKILKRSILLGGSAIKDFASAESKSGNFKQKFNVYNRKKEKCKTKKCPGHIKKIYTSGRSSFFCPRCQK